MFKPLNVAAQNRKYHGCFKLYENGMRPFNEKGDHSHPSKDKWCYLSTNDPFWKRVQDVYFNIQTRALKKRNKITNTQEIIDCLTI